MARHQILAAVDGSAHSSKIIDSTIEFARLLDAEVLLVYCHEKFPTIIVKQPFRYQAIAGILAEGEKLLEPFLQRLRDVGIAVEVRLLEEPAGKAISDMAKAENCKMIIMGSRGLSNLTHLFVGSVTNRVLQTAPCPVLVVC
jgi:nucleotide-binding universal stress UspA family protein